MLLYPSIDELTEKVDSKYTLAVMASKRARDLIDKKPRLVETDKIKPISIATEEISEDMISYKREAQNTEAPVSEESADIPAESDAALPENSAEDAETPEIVNGAEE